MKTSKESPVVEAAKEVDATHHTAELSRKLYSKKKAEADAAFEKMGKDNLAFIAAKDRQKDILMKLQ